MLKSAIFVADITLCVPAELKSIQNIQNIHFITPILNILL